MDLRSPATPDSTLHSSSGTAIVGMKRQREQRVSWRDQDADGDRRMEGDTDDTAMGIRDAASDDDGSDAPSRKRAMLIKTNLRFLEKIPPLRDYQRSGNGRRGAIDGGTVAGSLMMAALEESFEETSFVTLEPPTREAMVAPAPREVSPTQAPQRIRPVVAASRNFTSEKDDEARPASE